MIHKNDSNAIKTIITLIRVAIGWHFLYEGISKLFIENWTSYNFLLNTTGFLSNFYHWLAESETLLIVVDNLNIYGLIIIGLGLFLGIFSKYSSLFGIVLLTLYYFAYPPFGTSLFNPTAGHLFIINQNIIEAVILIFLFIHREKGYGIDSLLINIKKIKDNKKLADENGEDNDVQTNSRRDALKNLATLPLLGIFGWGVLRKKGTSIDVMSSATIKLKFTSLNNLKGELPKGKIGNLEISRLVAGGNLIGGWAHSRDLHYVPSLFRAYNTENKVYETLMLAEKAGINTINIGFPSNPLLAKYKKATNSKIKVITQVAPDMENDDYFININKAVDYGVDIIQVQGNWCDWLVRDNKIDVIEKMIENIRGQGYIAGLASHTVDALMACEEEGIIPDYYMKTMHHDNYWSAHPKENRVAFEVDGERHIDHNKFHDNIFCLYPDKTVQFVERAKVPVMGFKVLAAGAIKPEDGFKWAFDNGADFICVGMFDFQIVDDVNLTIDTLNSTNNRKRKWYA